MLKDDRYPYHRDYRDNEDSKPLLHPGIRRLWADDMSGRCCFLLLDENSQAGLIPTNGAWRIQWMLAPDAYVPRRGGAKAETGMEEGPDLGSRFVAPWEDLHCDYRNSSYHDGAGQCRA